MGDQNVKLASEDRQLQRFMQLLLRDVQALEQMLDGDMFESGITRIGAEQEMCLIDKHFRPAPASMEVLEKANNPMHTLELARFNYEVNLEPLEFTGTCLSDLEHNILNKLEGVRSVANQIGVDILLAGIAPTIRKIDVDMDNITPVDRYRALMKAINKLRGGVYELRLRGIDELIFKTDSPLLEAANTGFQVHLQTAPQEFVQLYNIAQAIAAPTLAVATNSPMLFGKRLWAETRIALFQQSVDTRVHTEHLRERSPRVTFGHHWLDDSILEIYKEDISRFRALLTSNQREDALEMLAQKKIPSLKALQVHNSTVYRWNRPCYGVANNIPHLRIENRVLPAGPTVVDEVANAAFWLGLMKGMALHYKDVTNNMAFDHAKSNFLAASIHGLETRFRWMDGKRYAAADLIREELIPLAKEGLQSVDVAEGDIEKYLGIIEERNNTGMTGAHWMTDSYAELSKVGTKDEVMTTLTANIFQKQRQNQPVHTWRLASFTQDDGWKPQSLLVEEFMTTDLFTAQRSDILEFVADMMDWRRIRYMPVEDNKGKLVGLITSRILLRECVRKTETNAKPIAVKQVMIENPITIHPEASILEAMNIMEHNKIGCLPVVKKNKLVGIITEQNFMGITRRLIDRLSQESE